MPTDLLASPSAVVRRTASASSRGAVTPHPGPAPRDQPRRLAARPGARRTRPRCQPQARQRRLPPARAGDFPLRSRRNRPAKDGHCDAATSIRGARTPSSRNFDIPSGAVELPSRQIVAEVVRAFGRSLAGWPLPLRNKSTAFYAVGGRLRVPSQKPPPPITISRISSNRRIGSGTPPSFELVGPGPGAAVPPSVAEAVAPAAAVEPASVANGVGAPLPLAAAVASGDAGGPDGAGPVAAAEGAADPPAVDVAVARGLDCCVGAGVGVGDGLATKVTAIVTSVNGTSNVHVNFVEWAQGPVLHSENADPASGSAVKVRFVPSAKSRPHASGHLRPAGVL